MLSLNGKKRITCENCGTQTPRNNIVRHKKRSSVGTLYFSQCPDFSTKSENDLNYHIALRNTAPQNFMSPSSVNFVINFALYVNIKALNTECSSDQKQDMWMWNT